MKNIISLLFFVCAFMYQLNAQQDNDWKAVFLDPTGNHIQHGIEVYFKPSICNGKDVVMLKLVNTNNYNVELSWFNAFFTGNKTWVKHNLPEQKITFYLQANTAAEGNCQDNTQLVFALDKANLTASTFIRLTTEYFTVLRTN